MSDAPTTGAAFAAAPARGTSPEVTRQMCVSAYLDSAFRALVIALLVDGRERFVAPSLGFDAVPVVAHCLRARELERKYAARALLAWVLGALTGVLILFLLVSAVSSFARGEGTGLQTVLLFLAAAAALGACAAPHVVGQDRRENTVLFLQNAMSFLWPPMSAVAHREEVKRILADELSETSFTGIVPDGVSEAWSPLLYRIGREQYSQVVVYDPDVPFAGAGTALRTQVIAQELVPDKKRGKEPEPLTERRILELVRPRLEALAEPPEAHSLDRLRKLELCECVFLPGPLPFGFDRDDAPLGNAGDRGVAEHLRRSTGEGGELRRHFLRIRVGGWEEQVVLTFFVRVHTQGGVLLLEISPYLLSPLHEGFRRDSRTVEKLVAGKDVDREISSRLATYSRFGALLRPVPEEAEEEGFDPDSWAFPPRTGIRELSASGTLSDFQTTDVVRYVRTILSRVNRGVEEALREAGYATEDFKQQTINMGAGAVFVDGPMSGGALATARGASAQDNSVNSDPGGKR